MIDKFLDKLYFYSVIFTYGVDPILDSILNKELDSGISEYSSSGFIVNITFKTGVKATLWNGNKWYAWLSEGRIGKYTWDCARPRKKTMWRLIKEIEKYFVENYE